MKDRPYPSHFSNLLCDNRSILDRKIKDRIPLFSTHQLASVRPFVCSFVVQSLYKLLFGGIQLKIKSLSTIK